MRVEQSGGFALYYDWADRAARGGVLLLRTVSSIVSASAGKLLAVVLVLIGTLLMLLMLLLWLLLLLLLLISTGLTVPVAVSESPKSSTSLAGPVSAIVAPAIS